MKRYLKHGLFVLPVFAIILATAFFLCIHFFLTPKILLVGFRPYNGDQENSSWEAIKQWKTQRSLLDDLRFRYRVLILPVNYQESDFGLNNYIESESPEIILMFGVNYTAETVRLESIARGEDGKTINSSLPLENMKEDLRKENIETVISKHAGSYVCNAVFYDVMRYVEKSGLNTKAGFIHLPDENVNGFTKEVLGKVVSIALRSALYDQSILHDYK